MMAGIGDVDRFPRQRRDQPSGGNLAVGEKGRFQRDAKPVRRRAKRQKTAVEAERVMDRGGNAVGMEPMRPADLLVVAEDQVAFEQIARRPYPRGHVGTAERRHGLRPERDRHDIRGMDRAVDDVGVEIAGGETGVVRAGGKPHLDSGMRGEETRQTRRQTGIGKRRGGMDPQHVLRLARRHDVEAAPQLIESGGDMPHQDVTVDREPKVAPMPLEQADAQPLLQMAERM